MATRSRATVEAVAIKPPNIQTAVFRIVGNAPYVQNKFSAKAREEMKSKQEQGSTARSKKVRVAKDFLALYEAAIHHSPEGWEGLPASGFRGALIKACSLVGFHMTKARLSIFIEADGFDVDDGTPLVRFVKGKPRYSEHMVRLETGVADIRARPMWDPGWEADLRIRFDADQFTLADVSNLLMRVGLQVGIGEGRHDGKKTTSFGMGWGTFEIGGNDVDDSRGT